MKRRILHAFAAAIAVLGFALGAASAAAQSGDGYVGIYTDSAGTIACTTVPPFTGTTLYVVAHASGATSNGITGTELRVEVTNPGGWFFSYIPPLGATPLGSLIDTDPASESDGSGLNIAFAACRTPDANGCIPLGVISAFNAGAGPTNLLVKRHSVPSNNSFQCPAFVLCDAPAYTMICMSASTEEPCSLAVAKSIAVRAASDSPVFGMGLNAQVERTPRDPGGRSTETFGVVARPTLVLDLETPDVVMEVPSGKASKALQDTMWVVDWTFDGGCDGAGWTKYDNRVLNDGQHFWSTTDVYHGIGGISGKAAVLRSFGACWADSGYANDWDQSLRLNYHGAANLSFDVLLDTEPNDNMTIEADPGCASQATTDISKVPSDLRTRLPGNASTWGGSYLTEHIEVTLPYEPDPSCVYIRFSSDGSGSDEDGLFNSSLHAGLVIDNIVMTGWTAYSENFESQTWNANVVPVNSAPSLAVGEWARLYPHVTDNDKCSENTTCAWLWSDPLRGAYYADMAFGPGNAIIRNWLDDVLVSPWVSVGAAGGLSGTILSFREFPGNEFHKGKIMRSWSVRGKPNGGCVSPWSNDSDHKQGTWQDLSAFTWVTRLEDASLFVPSTWDSLQIRFRVSDWRYVFEEGPPVTLNPGPGPYIDRVRIGRVPLTGPVISEGEDSRSQAQDAFPDYDLSLHDTASFSASVDLAPWASPWVVPADSIWVSVVDRREAGGIQSVRLYAVIVAGPHAGKAPPPYTVAGDSLFFSVTADSCRNPWGAIAKDKFFVDLDDGYFRGGDVVRYFWFAVDAGQGKTSDPPGIPEAPENIAGFDLAMAEQLTGGLHEVNFLPRIDWDATYLARIAPDPHGNLEPTSQEIENSPQGTCILYVNKANLRRLSTQRTSFMYSLDRLGYRGYYDVYDVQVAWYAEWLRLTGYYNVHGQATLWVIGENVPTMTRLTPLMGPTMGLLAPADASLSGTTPTVQSVSSFRFVQSIGYSPWVSFPSFRLAGGCPERRDYDSFTPASDAVATHTLETALGDEAVCMRSRVVAETWESRYNTIMMPFSWMDVSEASGQSYELGARLDVAKLILNNALPINCVQQPVETGVEDREDLAELPKVSQLYQNSPNPCNPSTAIKFDSSEDAYATLRIYDLAGRLVRTLIAESVRAGRRGVAWDGRDDTGHRVASGVYLYELHIGALRFARKLVVMK